MFFSSLKRSTNQVPNAEGATAASVQGQNPETFGSGLKGTLFHKLLGRETLPDAGPDQVYENEAWAPEPYVGLFRRKRAIAEEQLPSKTSAQ